MHIYYKCRRRIFSALTTFLYSLLCVALRAALAGDHLQSYSDIKGIVHRSKKYYFLPNVSWEIFYEMDAFIHPVILRNSGAERNKEMYYLSILVSHCSLVCIQGSLFFSPSAPRCLLGPLSPQTRRAIWARENSWELSIWILEQTQMVRAWAMGIRKLPHLELCFRYVQDWSNHLGHHFVLWHQQSISIIGFPLIAFTRT